MQNITRRDALRLFGASASSIAVGAALSRAADTPVTATQQAPDTKLRDKARKHFKLGIFTAVYASLPLDEAARRMKEDGFSCVVLGHGYQFKDIRFDPTNPDWEVLKKITGTLDKHDLEVVGLFGYYNVVNPNEEQRKTGEQHMNLLIKNWKRFGSPIISTETGTFNTQSPWEADPKNYTEHGYRACRTALEKHVREAEKTKAVIAIECYWKNIIDSAERTERLFNDIDSPALKLTMDPCNYFRNDDLPKMDAMVSDIFKRVGRQTVLAHAKDVKPMPDGGQTLPAAGKGVMNYPLYLCLLAELDRPIPLVIEHLQLDDVARARDYVKSQIDRI